jgi:hypothetical protein
METTHTEERHSHTRDDRGGIFIIREGERERWLRRTERLSEGERERRDLKTEVRGVQLPSLSSPSLPSSPLYRDGRAAEQKGQIWPHCGL